MNRNPRRKVVEIVTRANTGPSKDFFPECATALLECGHSINCGVSVDYAKVKKWMACGECLAPPEDQG